MASESEAQIQGVEFVLPPLGFRVQGLGLRAIHHHIINIIQLLMSAGSTQGRILFRIYTSNTTRAMELHTSYSLNFLKRGLYRDYLGEHYRGYSGGY